MRVLKIKSETFNATHYLPNHPKCGCIHGHTYFVENIEVLYDETKFVDFGDIKAIVKSLDHKLLVPYAHAKFWTQAKELHQNIGCFYNIVEIPYGSPTVENIMRFLHEALKSLPGVEEVSLDVFEGPNQGVSYIPDEPLGGTV